VTHLLDSSGFFAFFFNERGRERVESLLSEPAAQVGLSVVTSVELWARLKAEGRPEVFDQEWAEHLALFDRVIPIDIAVCQLAIKLRGCATDRLPTIDSLIAATAAVHNAVLIHRDPHFMAIPKEMLEQEFLG
jgi:predicted nucleic acid-binding protein